MNIEQLKQILEQGEKIGATHVSGKEYYCLEIKYTPITEFYKWFIYNKNVSWKWEDVGDMYMTELSDIQLLSDIKQIVELSEQVEKLKEKYGDAFYDGFIAARDIERELTHGSISDYDDDAVIAISEQAESEVLQELTK